jgi:ribosome recycling factor
MIQSNAGLDTLEFDIARAVRPLQLRLALKAVAHLALIGVALALAGIAAVQAYARMLAWPEWDPLGGPGHWSLAIAVACAALVCVGSRRSWPGVSTVARHADRALDFKDRLSTAYEYRGQQSAYLRLLRADLMVRWQQIDARRAAPMRLAGPDLGLAASMALLLVGVLALPDRQAGVQQQLARDRAAARSAAQMVEQAAQRLAPLPSSHPAPAATESRAEQQAEQALRNAEAGLAAAKNKAEALKALSRARQQLQHLQAQSQVAASALRRLAGSLKNSPAAALAQAIASGQASAVPQSAQSLVASAPKLTEQQRTSLVQSLERAANTTGSGMSQSLREAASAAANNDPAALSQALQSLSNNVQQAEDQAAAQRASTQGLAALQEARQRVASAQASQSPRQTGAIAPVQASGRRQAGSGSQAPLQQAGAGAAQRLGVKTRTNTASAPGQRQSGKSAGGQAAGAKAGAGGLTASAGQGRRGGSGSGQRGGGGSKAGKLETVYTPLREGSGPADSQLTQPGTSIPVQSGAFQQLLARYQALAIAGPGRSSLPADLQTEVRKYFAALGAG